RSDKKGTGLLKPRVLSPFWPNALPHGQIHVPFWCPFCKMPQLNDRKRHISQGKMRHPQDRPKKATIRNSYKLLRYKRLRKLDDLEKVKFGIWHRSCKDKKPAEFGSESQTSATSLYPSHPPLPAHRHGGWQIASLRQTPVPPHLLSS